MKTSHYFIKWNGYNCEVEAYVTHNEVEIENLTFTEEDSGLEVSIRDILLSLTPSRGNTVKNPIEEIEMLVLEADAKKRQEIAEGVYFSSCD